MNSARELSDAQWAILDPLIPEPPRRKDGLGRPWRARREVLGGILYILRTGAAWADLPERYPPYQTCHRRFQQWVKSGVMRGILEALAEDLRTRGGFDVREAFIDGSFASAKKGAWSRGKTKRGKGTKIMAVADSNGLPIAVCTESATPHEVILVQKTLAEIFVAEPIQRLIGDKAYDSEKLDHELAETGVEMIAPHRRTCKNRTQDGRSLRCYRRRWKVERLFAWLQNFRRLVTRYEYSLDNFTGMLHLACSMIILRCL
ncbi:IS5 family transposase [Bryobacter aggregatus]|uniref:IS5 family transposase n=1 Tax=Bryobacter aggregatus TaxID=360054 RepID=UPI00192E6E96|nr:IS5 family transposase [Bryobacter aggregatus]